MRKLNSRGVSLVAALISIAIVSIIAITVINLIGISGDVLTSFQSSIRAMDAAQEVRFALTDPNSCTLNFKNTDLSTATKTNAVKFKGRLMYPDSVDKTKLSTNEVINIENEEGERLLLEGFYFRRSAINNLVYVDIRLKKKDAPASAPPSHQRSLPLWVQTDASNRITCCTSLNMSSCP